MNILIAYGSKLGGTEGLAEMLGEALRREGFHVDIAEARRAPDPRKFSAVLVGGALYASRWHKHAARFVITHAKALREREVWFFSSGPLDDSARERELPPVRQVHRLMELVGANGHATFGGRLEPNAKGFLASNMAKTRAGDWRDPAQIERWAAEVAHEVNASAAMPHPPRQIPPEQRLPAGLIGSCLFAGATALLGGLVLVASPSGALVHMTVSALQHSPFSSFLVPGLLLAGVVGGSNLWAAIAHLRRSDFAGLLSFVSGSALTVWIVVEMLMLRTVHPFQLVYLALGLAIAARSWRDVAALRGVFAPPAPAR
ncbi:MAG: hypothetical protein JST54_26750 [Deltaproteobacteria bacterium]|nr:hypothetical protein [Deltaproteobacteria bacterium]